MLFGWTGHPYRLDLPIAQGRIPAHVTDLGLGGLYMTEPTLWSAFAWGFLRSNGPTSGLRRRSILCLLREVQRPHRHAPRDRTRCVLRAPLPNLQPGCACGANRRGGHPRRRTGRFVLTTFRELSHISGVISRTIVCVGDQLPAKTEETTGPVAFTSRAYPQPVKGVQSEKSHAGLSRLSQF